MASTYINLPNDTTSGPSGSNPSVGSNNTPAPSYSTQIGGVDNSGNLIPIKADPSGALSVNGTFSSIGTSDTVESGTVDTAFMDVTNVAMNNLTTIAAYAAGGPTRCKFVEVSGTNIATYTVLVNGVVINKKQTFYGYLDNDFQFSKGYNLALGDVMTVQVVHQQPSVGEFSGFILVLKDY